MDTLKSKSLSNLEGKMQNIGADSFRYHVLEHAKNFKSSWIELGRSLYTVSKDKLYREWGYSSFEIYVAKEIGIRKLTAMKLLRSYYFLEKEEPAYLKTEYVEKVDAAKIPSYESVDVLRQAKKNKALDEEEYQEIKKQVFEKSRDAKEIKKGLTSLIRQREVEDSPEEAREKRKFSTVKRFIGTLKAIKSEAEINKLLPAAILKETAALIAKLEQEIA